MRLWAAVISTSGNGSGRSNWTVRLRRSSSGYAARVCRSLYYKQLQSRQFLSRIRRGVGKCECAVLHFHRVGERAAAAGREPELGLGIVVEVGREVAGLEQQGIGQRLRLSAVAGDRAGVVDQQGELLALARAGDSEEIARP